MTNITTLDSAHVTPAGRYVAPYVSFSRPADVLLYAALDVISDDAETAKVMRFDAGRSGAILRATVAVEEAKTITPRLYVFNAEPTNFADNAALALTSADLHKLVAVFQFGEAFKEAVGGSALNYYIPTGTLNEEVGLPVPFTSADGYLYGILQTVSGYTPGSAIKTGVRLHIDRGADR